MVEAWAVKVSLRIICRFVSPPMLIPLYTINPLVCTVIFPVRTWGYFEWTFPLFRNMSVVTLQTESGPDVQQSNFFGPHSILRAKKCTPLDYVHSVHANEAYFALFGLTASILLPRERLCNWVALRILFRRAINIRYWSSIAVVARDLALTDVYHSLVLESISRPSNDTPTDTFLRVCPDFILVIIHQAKYFDKSRCCDILKSFFFSQKSSNNWVLQMGQGKKETFVKSWFSTYILFFWYLA